MNIFILDNDPIVAAQQQCDKHVVKMIVESAQMLSTAHRMLDGTLETRPSKSGKRMVKYYRHPDENLENTLYKAVHYHHPCTVWTMKIDNNYMWHYDHFRALCKEYTYRYGKIHKTEPLLTEILRSTPKNIKPGYKYMLSEFALAMQHEPQCMHPGNPVKSYREYYKTKQDRFKMSWTKRECPDWFTAVAS